jgi:hypothetical protein
MKANKRRRELHQVIAFGKHKGKTYKQVIDTEPSYIDWCLTNIANFRLTKGAEEYFIRAKNNANYAGADEDMSNIWNAMQGDHCGDQD